MKTLSVGCGKQPAQENLIRLDRSVEVEPDIIWDLNQFPYPFDNSSFTEIQCFDVIEHLEDIPKTLEEFYRLLAPKGLIKLTTPHFSCANSFIDPTHRWHLSYFTFDYFSQRHKLSYYSKANFLIKRRHLQFQGGRLNRSLISYLANQFPEAYEQRWAWIFPAWFIFVELEAIKDI